MNPATSVILSEAKDLTVPSLGGRDSSAFGLSQNDISYSNGF